MPTIVFKPRGVAVDVDSNTKVLVAANRHKVPIRFGCASCKCGTCGVLIAPESNGVLSPMKQDERALLARMDLETDGTVRLACQTRVLDGTVVVDLDFQNTYSPDQGDDEYADDDDGEDEVEDDESADESET